MNSNSIKRKLAAGVLAFGLVGGAGIAMAAPAQAVTEHRETYSGYATKARCQSVQQSTFQRLAATGKERTGYTPCHYQDSKRKWMFQVWWI